MTRLKAGQWEMQIPRAEEWGAPVWVSSELARRWFYSADRLAAWNGHQCRKAHEQEGNFIWILNQCSQVLVQVLRSQYCWTLFQLVLILAIASVLFLNTEAKQPDSFTTKQVCVVCTLLFPLVVSMWIVNCQAAKYVFQSCNNGHTTAYVRRICQLLVGL